MSDADFTLEFNDIQGFVIRGFGKLTVGHYLFFNIEDTPLFKDWLKKELGAGKIINASIRAPAHCYQECIAFSAQGLRKLQGDAWVEESYPLEFLEGMVQEQRSRTLGDFGPNDPEHWRWGNDGAIDGYLLIAAESEASADLALKAVAEAVSGMRTLQIIEAHIPDNRKEAFGFMDGISQPIIKGTDRSKVVKAKNSKDYALNATEAGEFILGYPDGSKKTPRSPAIQCNDTELKPHDSFESAKDFGRNGSYVVIRQLAQDVKGFEAFEKSLESQYPDVAAKLMGRDKEGKTLSLDKGRDTNDFDYLKDPQGLGCPIGAHVRRTNPRSTVHASSEEASLSVTNRHRIIRRGRNYALDDGEVGLLFVCLNASINRQFEFIQSTWSNDPFFQGLSDEVDPIIGTQRNNAEYFTIPKQPFRKKCKIPQFVTVKGGAYFFMPGISSLKVLTNP